VSSRQLEIPTWSRRAADRGKVLGTIALPFEAPVSVEFDAGPNLAELVEEAFAEGLIDRAWANAVAVYLGDWRVPRDQWRRVRPLPGRLVAIRALAQDPGTLAAVVNFAIQVAITVAVSAVLRAFAPDPAERSFEQVHEIDSSRNEVAPYRTVPCVLGRMRIFPPHAAKPFTRVIGEKVYLYVLLCLGIGPHALDTASLKIGDTAFSGFSGITWQAKLTPADPAPTLFPNQADEQDGAGLLPREEDVWYERTTDSSDCDEIEIELLHPEGLIRYKDDGSREGQTVRYRIRYRLNGTTPWLRWNDNVADDNGWLVEQTRQWQQPFRDTYTKSVARGKYDVAIKRIAASSDTSSNMKTDLNWTRLRSFTHEPPVADPNMALFAMRAEAGDQLNGIIDQINMIVTRIAPKWDAVAEAFGAAGESRTPAELVRWIATGPGVVKPRTSAQIDDAAFGAWAELCVAKGWHCDMEIRAGMPLDEAMALVARCGRATLGRRAGKLTPILDTEQAAPTQLFTPRNSWGFRAQRRFAPETHAYRLEFNNEEKNYVKDEMVVYFPGYDFATAELIETLAVAGKTSPLEINRDGKRAIAEALIRGEDYVFSADIESLTTARGKRAAVAHYVVAVGRISARVKAHVLNGAGTHVSGLELDEEIEQTLGETYGLVWRRVEGETISVETIALSTVSGVSHIVTLAADPGLPLASAPKVGDLVTFGDADIETIDTVVTNIAMKSDFEAEISAIPYVDELFEGDDAPEPVWESNVSSDAFPAPPAPEIGGVSANAAGIFVDFDYPLGTAHRVKEAEAYMKRVEESGERWELVGRVPAEGRLAVYPPGDRGVEYKLKLVAVGERGRRKESAERTVISAAFTGAITGHLSQPSVSVPTAADGSGGNYSTAGGTFHVSIGGVDVTGNDEVLVYSLAAASSGLSIAIDAVTGVYTITNLTVDAGQATLRATLIVTGETFDLVYTIAKAKAGSPGEPGDPPSAFTATIDIPTSATGVNLYDLAVAAGYTGLSDATITFEVESGINVTGVAGAPNGGFGIDTGVWPHTTYTIALTLLVKSGGIVRGGGGKGGAGSAADAGGSGGDAIYLRVPLTGGITFNSGSEVKGGGGGGGGETFDRINVGIPGEPEWQVWGGDGGNGGQPNGAGGAGGTGSNGGGSGAAGATATPTTVGTSGGGGDGGVYGAAGGNGAGHQGRLGGAGGAAGYCVRKNGHTATVTNNGTTAGTIG